MTMLRCQPMRHWPATLLLAASGCAQLFGIDATTGPDVDPLRVSLTMQRWSIGAAVMKNPQDLTPQTASFLVDDGAGNYTKLVGEQTNVDTFSVELPTGTPPKRFAAGNCRCRVPRCPSPTRMNSTTPISSDFRSRIRRHRRSAAFARCTISARAT